MFYGVPEFLDKPFNLPDGRLAAVGYSNYDFADRLEFSVQTAIDETTFDLELVFYLDNYAGTDTQAMDDFNILINNWIGSNYP